MPVDERGIRVDALRRADVDLVALTPAHQHPTGVVLAGDRRTELLAWLRERDAYAIDDDYDAEYRYDRAAVGALQGLDPERIVYAGSASKSLTPGIRLGWLVLPPALLEPVRQEKLIADRQTDVIQQHTFADFLARGELDRHLRRLRTVYRARRDALVAGAGGGAAGRGRPRHRGRAARHRRAAPGRRRGRDRRRDPRAPDRDRHDGRALDRPADRTADAAARLRPGAEASIRPGVRAIAEAVRDVRAGVFTTS